MTSRNLSSERPCGLSLNFHPFLRNVFDELSRISGSLGPEALKRREPEVRQPLHSEKEKYNES